MSGRNWSVGAGLALIVLGGLALLGQFVQFDWGHYAWPLFILVPGLVLLVSGWRGPLGVLIAGFEVTILGLVLGIQNLTGYFASWSYAWTLFPAGVGLALWLNGSRNGRLDLVTVGRTMFLVAFTVFLFAGLLFELVVGVDGFRNEVVARVAVPAILIVAGVALLTRTAFAGRRQE